MKRKTRTVLVLEYVVRELPINPRDIILNRMVQCISYVALIARTEKDLKEIFVLEREAKKTDLEILKERTKYLLATCIAGRRLQEIRLGEEDGIYERRENFKYLSTYYR